MPNLLNLFFEVICYADSTFSHKLKEEFFRDGVLKHSVERSKPKKTREKKTSKNPSASSTSGAIGININYHPNEGLAAPTAIANGNDIKHNPNEDVATHTEVEHTQHLTGAVVLHIILLKSTT